MKSLQEYNSILLKALAEFSLPDTPLNLYESINYIVNLGGKRLRPIMVLMGADAAGGSNDDSIKASLAIELFHNFSLMHDDIMDHADLRRGQPAVHAKWNVPTAILGGDALLVKTYEVLMNLKCANRDEIIKFYNSIALNVCEGQQMDMNFEDSPNVQIDEYIEMIRLKTAVLMGAAFKIGAMTKTDDIDLQEVLYAFGENLGIAFQIKDDYLDCFGDSSFGKKTGGDIIENKKTYLQLATLQLTPIEFKNRLKQEWTNDNDHLKVEHVKTIFEESGARKLTEVAMNEYYAKALSSLDELSLPTATLQFLSAFAKMVWERQK